jgi:hypothetical protein
LNAREEFHSRMVEEKGIMISIHLCCHGNFRLL